MAIKTAMVIRKAGEQLPEAYRKTLMDKFTTGFGYASPQASGIHTGKFLAEKISDEEIPGITQGVVLADSLEEVDRVYKDDTVYYHFFDLAGDSISLDSIQPFTLLSEKDDQGGENIYLAAITQGEFAAHANKKDEDDDDTSDLRMVNDFLTPTIDEIVKQTDGDLEKVCETLDTPTIRNAVRGHNMPAGTIVILPCVGKPVSFIENQSNKAQEFGWGFTSDALGYTEKAPVVASQPPKIKVKVGGATPKAEEKKTVLHNPDKGAEEALKYAELMKKSDNFIIYNSELWVKPPKGMNGKALKQWWNNNCSLPQQRTGQEVLDYQSMARGFAAKDLKVNSALKQFMDKIMKGEGPAEAETIQAPVEKQDQPPAPKPEFSLWIKANQKAAFREVWNKKQLPAADLDGLKKTLEYPPATEQLGISVNEFRMLKPEAFARIVHDLDKHITVCLLHELRMHSLGLISATEQKPEEKKEEAAPPSANPNAAKPKLKIKVA